MKILRIIESLSTVLSALMISQIASAETGITAVHGKEESRAQISESTTRSCESKTEESEMCRVPVKAPPRCEPEYKCEDLPREFCFSKQESEFAQVTALKLRKYLL